MCKEAIMTNDKALHAFLSSGLPKCRYAIGAGNEIIVYTGMCVAADRPNEDGSTNIRHMTSEDFLKVQIEHLQAQVAQMSAILEMTNGGDRDGYSHTPANQDPPKERTDNVIVGPWAGSGEDLDDNIN